MVGNKTMAAKRKEFSLRPLPAMALATAGAAALGTNAFADSDFIKRGPDTVVRNQTVFERQRPIYDAKGIELGGGGLTLLPELEVSETYDDNVFAQSSNKKDDFETVIAPRFALKSNWSRHSFGLSGFGAVHRYADLQSEDNKEYGVDASGTLDLPRQSSLAAQAGYQRVTVLRGDPEQSSGVGSAPEQIYVKTAKLQYSHPFGRVGLTLGGAVNDYETVANSDPFSNRTDYTGNVRVAYQISAALSAFAEPYYTTRRYEQGNRDVDILGVGFGVTYDITGQLYGETQVGYYTAKFDNPAFQDQSGIFIRSEATWNLSALTSIISGIERGNQASNVGTASSSTNSAIDLRVERELARNITAALTARYQHEVFEDTATNRVDDVISVGWVANYLLDRHVALFLKYNFTDRSSDDAPSEYSDNQIMLGIKGQI